MAASVHTSCVPVCGAFYFHDPFSYFQIDLSQVSWFDSSCDVESCFDIGASPTYRTFDMYHAPWGVPDQSYDFSGCGVISTAHGRRRRRGRGRGGGWGRGKRMSIIGGEQTDSAVSEVCGVGANPCVSSSLSLESSSSSSQVSMYRACNVTGIDSLCGQFGGIGSAILLGNPFWQADILMFKEAKKDLSRLFPCTVGELSEDLSQDLSTHGVDIGDKRTRDFFLLLLGNLPLYRCSEFPPSTDLSCFMVTYGSWFQSKLAADIYPRELLQLTEDFLREHTQVDGENKFSWPGFQISESELCKCAQDTVIQFCAGADSDSS